MRATWRAAYGDDLHLLDISGDLLALAGTLVERVAAAVEPYLLRYGHNAMQRTPAAVGREVLIRDIATFVLTFDHRALDGAPAGRFLARLKRLLESPDAALFAQSRSEPQ